MSNSVPPSAVAVRMTPAERRATLGLASISGLRLLGMFIILPVLALYTETLPGGASHLMVGVALGAYGLTQALLQIPFGWASDRIGRKPVLHLGLVILAAGSFLAAWAPDIHWIIVGRALQGAGAISAVVIAMAADLTREDVRTRTMAVIGITIGSTFALSLIGGPLLTTLIGVPGIFALTGALSLGAMAVVQFAIPNPPATTRPLVPVPDALRRALTDPQLLRLNYGMFALHAVLMALFVQIPFSLRDGGLAPDRHWTLYLPVLLLSILLMWPFLRSADRPGRGKQVFVGAVAALLVAQLALALSLDWLPGLALAMTLFFTAFNLLEATLPSLVSKYAPADIKGTAVGVYACLQFLGAFVGAVAGGWLAQHAGGAAVFVLGVLFTAIWLAACATMATPPAHYGRNYSLGET